MPQTEILVVLVLVPRHLVHLTQEELVPPGKEMLEVIIIPMHHILAVEAAEPVHRGAMVSGLNRGPGVPEFQIA